jgi:long-chain acyl-CoA synthetase
MKKYTIPSFLRNSVEIFSDQIALTFIDETGISYRDLGNKIEETVALLSILGIERGDKVAMIGENMPNWAIAYLSTICMGAIAVPILPDFHENEVQNILSHSESKILFASKKQIARLKTIVSGKILVVEADSLTPMDSTPAEPTSPPVKVKLPEMDEASSESDLATIIYTSGTTGSSKGVMLSNKNLAWMVNQILTLQPVASGHRFLSILPMSHTYENSLGLLLPLYTGASVFYLKKQMSPSTMLEALAKVKPTHLLTVPLIIEKIFKKQVLPKFNKSAVTRNLFKFGPTRVLLNRLAGKKLMKTFGGELIFFGIGGAKLDGRIEKYLTEARFPFAIGYGLTETAPVLAGSKPFETPWQSTGKILEGVDLKIDNPDPETGEGEIIAKGPNLMLGYYKNPEATKQVITPDGYFKTGDLGIIDSKGTLFIKGRIKNLILGTNGENIYPEEIESIINSIEYIEESLVVRQKDKLVAYVNINIQEMENKLVKLNEKAIKVCNESMDELLVEIQTFVNQRVNKYSRIQLVILHTTPFEKTPTNKIKRFLYGG